MYNLRKIIKGYVIATALFFLFTMIAALLMKLTPLPERYGLIYIMVAVSLACLYIGMYGGKLVKRRGLFFGAVFGLALIAILLAVSMVSMQTAFSAEIVTPKYLIPVAISSVGGVVGANLKG